MDDAEIFELFKYRCVMCWHPATEINHIIPRSRNKSLIDDPDNKVPMCNSCHDWYHSGGVTKKKIETVRAKRIEMLTIFGITSG